MTPDTTFMYAYGLYLANGGTPEGFQHFTMDDANIMLTSYIGLQKNNTKDILEGLVDIISKMFGGQ